MVAVESFVSSSVDTFLGGIVQRIKQRLSFAGHLFSFSSLFRYLSGSRV